MFVWVPTLHLLCLLSVQACNRSTHVVSALNLTSSFHLAAENILDVNGTLGRGLVADSRQNMFPFRSSPAALGQPFYDEVTVAGWGDCGGAYLRGPTGDCLWDGSDMPPTGACQVQVNYLLPNQIPPAAPAASCPPVPFPFSYNLTAAAGIDFLVQCLSSGQVYLPSIDVIITSFGQGNITIDKKLFSKVGIAVVFSCAVLCCAVPCCAVLRCTAMCCAVLWCDLLQWVVLCCFLLLWDVLGCDVLQCALLCCDMFG